VIFIKGIKTYERSYVLIVYRTASILYRVDPDRLEEESIYITNSKKTPSYKADLNSKHQNNSRFYFTSARVELLFDESTIERFELFTQKLQLISSTQGLS